MGKIFLIVLCLSAFFLSGCGKRENRMPSNCYGDTISCIIVHKDILPSSDVLELKDYPVTGYIEADSLQGIMCYNYRLHSLDLINLKGDPCVLSFPLQREGPDGVSNRVKSIVPLSLDSIWLYDGAMFCLVDSAGKVHDRFSPSADVLVLLETNYAMHTAKLVYDCSRHSLLYPVLKGDSVFVEEYGLRQRDVLHRYYLKPSLCNPDNLIAYADFRFPNVNVAKGKIVYNYPYESTIYVLDQISGAYSAFGGASAYTSNEAPRCKSQTDYAVWQRYGIENTHFYDVMYLPEVGMYARVHIKGTDFNQAKPLDELLNTREMYLMFFDSEFRIVKEMKLEACRYSCFTSWCALPRAISLFENNSLSDSINDEKLSLSMIRIAE